MFFIILIRATQSQKAATYTQLIGACVINAEEVRQALKNDENSGFTEIDAEIPEELEQDGFNLQDLASKQEESETPEKAVITAAICLFAKRKMKTGG